MNMNKLVHLLYLSLLVSVGYIVFITFNPKKKVKVVERRVTDTLIYKIVDTIVEYKPQYITKTIIDTLYLPIDSNMEHPLYVEQNHYKNDGIYDVWVSGYKATLDSVKTYPQIEYRTITNTITKETIINKANLYPYMGIKLFNGCVNPTIGVALKTDKNSMYMGEIGSIDGNMYYGISCGIKIK